MAVNLEPLNMAIAQLSRNGTVSAADLPRYRQLMAQRNALAGSGSGGGSGGSGNDRITAARDEMYGLARDRIGELREDPVDAEVLAALRARATGDDVPYNETTTNALFGQQAEMNAQAQRNALDRIQTRGGSITDPAYQAQLQAAQARSDANMQRARMGVDTQANLANYDARGQALGQTGAFNQLRNQGITSVEDRLLGLLSREEDTPRTGGVTTYSTGGQQQQQPQSARSPDFTMPTYSNAQRAGQVFGQRPAQPQAIPQPQAAYPQPQRPPATAVQQQRTTLPVAGPPLPGGGRTNIYDATGIPIPAGRIVRSSLPD